MTTSKYSRPAKHVDLTSNLTSRPNSLGQMVPPAITTAKVRVSPKLELSTSSELAKQFSNLSANARTSRYNQGRRKTIIFSDPVEVTPKVEAEVKSPPVTAPAAPEAVKAPAVGKRINVKNMSLDELYESPKITPTVLKRILDQDDFVDINRRYCDRVCSIPCDMKAPGMQRTQLSEIDIMIIQENPPMDEKFKDSRQLTQLHQRQIGSMLGPISGGMSYRLHSMLKCKPTLTFVKGKVKKITYTQRSRCSIYLINEIIRSKPKVIISMSTDVTKALGIKKSNYNNRGEFHYTDHPLLEEQIPVVLTLHPHVLNMIRQTSSGAMYGQDYYDVIRRDMHKAVCLARGDYRPVINEEELRDNCYRVAADQIIVTKSIEEVKYWVNHMINDLPVNTVISWDLETTSLDPWSADARIITSQFGFRRGDGKIQAIVIPLWHRENDYFDPDEAWDISKEILISKVIPKVGHNVKFDVVFAEVTTGIQLENVLLDTLLAIHSVNSGIQGNYSLKTAIWDYLPSCGLGGYENLLKYEDEA